MTSNPQFIAAVIGFIIVVTGLIKVITDILKIKADRLQTKESRDKDSLEMHDALLKHGFEINALKDNQVLHSQLVNDLRDVVGVMNSNIVKLTTNVDNLTEVVKELKNDK